MDEFLLDTNVLIYYNSDIIPTENMAKFETILKSSFIISVITKMEYLGWKEFTEDAFPELEHGYFYCEKKSDLFLLCYDFTSLVRCGDISCFSNWK